MTAWPPHRIHRLSRHAAAAARARRRRTRRWRRSPGSASAARPRCWCARPMPTISAHFLRALPRDMPVHVIGACSNLIIRDGGLPGVTIRLARGFRRDRGWKRDGVDRRRRRAGCDGGGTCRRGGADRAGVPVRHSRHDRRRGGDERRRLWRRRRRRASTGPRSSRASGERRRLAAADLAFAYRHAASAARRGRDARRGCARGPARRRRSRRAWRRSARRARRRSRCARAPAVPRSATRPRHEGVGADRRRRLPRPDPRRRAWSRRSTAIS